MSETIDTVGELIEYLDKYDTDTPVRVNDDGRLMTIHASENHGVIEL